MLEEVGVVHGQETSADEDRQEAPPWRVTSEGCLQVAAFLQRQRRQWEAARRAPEELLGGGRCGAQ